MERVRLTAERIRALEIQGATAIARSALLAYAQDLAEGGPAGRENLSQTLVEARPNEPMLRNLLTLFDQRAADLSGRDLVDLAGEMLEGLDADEEELHRVGAELVEDGSKIFTHCHSSSAVGILLKAHRDGKRFRVFTTETRPRFQGRITARELARAGIPVDHSVDSAAKYALDGASLFLFGADAILASGFLLNKVGTGIFCVVARHYGVPTYSATHTLKVVKDRDEVAVEERDRREVWDEAPEGVTIRNPAFDRVNLKYVSGIVTEKGILRDILGEASPAAANERSEG